MALLPLESMLFQSPHNLQFIDQNEPATIPTGSFFILPVPSGEPYASPWQTNPAILHLNCPEEKHQQIFKQVVAILKEEQKPFTLSTQTGQQTDSHAILVHGACLSDTGIDLLVLVQPNVLKTGPIQVYPLITPSL